MGIVLSGTGTAGKAGAPVRKVVQAIRCGGVGGTGAGDRFARSR